MSHSWSKHSRALKLISHCRDVKTTTAAELLPGSVMLPLLEFIVLEDDDAVLHFAAVTMSKCTLMSSYSDASVTDTRGFWLFAFSLMFELLQENFWSIGTTMSDL